MSQQPTAVSKSRIKKLQGVRKPQVRLRVEQFRVFYDVGDGKVTVLAVVPKDRAEEWLNREGEPADD